MLAGVALAGFVLAGGESALGADYPVLRGSQVEDAPPTPREFFGSSGGNWSGFYFGGTVGYSTGQFDAYKQSDALSKQAFDQLAINQYGVNLIRLGKASDDKVAYGAFMGYNYQFGDAVLGLELDYQRVNFMTDQRSSISRSVGDVFAGVTPSSITTEPAGTETFMTVTGRSTNRLEDFGVAKLRAGYAFGNFMPFATIGAALGRIRSDGNITQTNTTVEYVNNFQAVPVIDPTTGAVTYTRGGFRNTTTNTLFSGGRSAGTPKSGYAAGFAIGGGLEALLGENILLRAEFQRVYFNEYKGVETIVDTARIGAGLKF
jgi:opacity protein-like surface antigen